MQDRGRDAARERLRVLLVEDVPDIREVFGLLLHAESVDVVATGSGREAAELAAHDDVARRRPRVIVVTGYDEPFVSRARHAGADMVFNKPVVWSALADTLAQIRRHDRLAGRLAAA